MKNLLNITLILIITSSCSEYQKALKSTNIAEKFAMGTELYDDGKFGKANRLFVQIVPKYRGKPQAEKLMYMYSRTFYEMRDFYTANYQMERFVNAYPESIKAEEIAFLAAKSYYFLSPVYSKEQKETVDAIGKLQGFINSYPDSEYLASANTLVKELDYKLEKKAFEIAKEYNTTGPYSRDYQAAISAFDNFIIDFIANIFNCIFNKTTTTHKLHLFWTRENSKVNPIAVFIFKFAYTNTYTRIYQTFSY